MPGRRPFDIETLASVVDDVAEAVIVVDDDGTVVYANRATETTFGHPPGSLVGRSYEIMVPEHARTRHAAHHRDFLERPAARPMGRGLVLRALHALGYEVDVTIALVPIRSPSPMTAVVIRELTTSQRQFARLAATNQLLTAALAGASRREVEQQSVDLARELLAADAVEVVDVATDDLVVRSPELDGDSSGKPAPDGRSIIECAIGVSNRELSMSAMRSSTARPFDDLDQQIVGEFAGAIAVTLELIDARSEVAVLRSIADHDRIGRDLHDRVIQRLFAIAMGLESIAAGASGLTRDRVAEAVDSLDEVIREIRTTIFGLRTSVGPPGLRAAVADEIDAVAQTLGFAPSLRFVGSTDDVPDDLRDAAVAVVRELLSNVARHSRARFVDVLVGTVEGRFIVTVDDDGVGLPAETEMGNGLANLQERADRRGGSFRTERSGGGGVRAEWQVPFEPWSDDAGD